MYIPPIVENVNEVVFERLQIDITKLEGKGSVLVMGDFNARMGELASTIYDVEKDEPTIYKRTSEDKTTSYRGKHLMDTMNEVNMVLVNGLHKVANFTSHQAAGNATIDLV